MPASLELDSNAKRMLPLFTDHFENVLVLIIQNEVYGGLLDLKGRAEGHVTAQGWKVLIYLAWGK